MKELIFSGGKVVGFTECYGSQRYVQGAQREVLDFRFDAAGMSLDEVDALFTTESCTRLTIRETTTVQAQQVDDEGNLVFESVPQLNDDGGAVLDENGDPVVVNMPVMVNQEQTAEYIYDNYGVRVELSKQTYTLSSASGAADVEQISVKMAQCTPTELQLAAMSGAVGSLIAESLTA